MNSIPQEVLKAFSHLDASAAPNDDLWMPTVLKSTFREASPGVWVSNLNGMFDDEVVCAPIPHLCTLEEYLESPDDAQEIERYFSFPADSELPDFEPSYEFFRKAFQNQ